jgi:hypothetical protein
MVCSVMGSSAFAEVASTEKAVEGLSSNKTRGTVTISAEPDLDKGRLILKVIGTNRTDQPVSLTDGDVEVFTSAGRRVGLVKLDRLIAEVRGETSRRPFDRDADGTLDDRMGTMDPDERGPLGRTPPDYGTPSSGHPRNDDRSSRGVIMDQGADSSTISAHVESPIYQAKVDSLKNAILKAEVIQPAKAGGGKLVTEKLRFGRKDEHVLRVRVNFAGEEHEFTFVPPQS